MIASACEYSAVAAGKKERSSAPTEASDTVESGDVRRSSFIMPAALMESMASSFARRSLCSGTKPSASMVARSQPLPCS